MIAPSGGCVSSGQLSESEWDVTLGDSPGHSLFYFHLLVHVIFFCYILFAHYSSSIYFRWSNFLDFLFMCFFIFFGYGMNIVHSLGHLLIKK